MLRSIKKILTLSCKESRELQARAMEDGHLGLVDRLALAGHQLACRVCRRLHSQLKQVEKAVITLPPLDEHPMPAEVESRIADSIRDFASQKGRK